MHFIISFSHCFREKCPQSSVSNYKSICFIVISLESFRKSFGLNPLFITFYISFRIVFCFESSFTSNYFISTWRSYSYSIALNSWISFIIMQRFNFFFSRYYSLIIFVYIFHFFNNLTTFWFSDSVRIFPRMGTR